MAATKLPSAVKAVLQKLAAQQLILEERGTTVFRRIEYWEKLALELQLLFQCDAETVTVTKIRRYVARWCLNKRSGERGRRKDT